MGDLDRAQLALEWSKRDAMFGVAALIATRALAAAHEESPGLSPSAALTRLKDGNLRYAAGRSGRPDLSLARRRELAGGQHPFATIVACADSRVGPELIFDQARGDLFVIRVAGNVVDDLVVGSIEYSVIQLGVPLVMVLGHDHCGAVAAAAKAQIGKPNPEDHNSRMRVLAGLIAPAVKAVPASAPDKVEAAVLLNARHAAAQLVSRSRAVGERVRTGSLQVVSARYCPDDAKVSEIGAAQL
jgi:carbonic anhydrase